MNKCRVLVILPFYGGSLPIGRYVASAFKELGHLVEVFEAPQFFSAFSALKNLRVGTNRLEQLEQGFINQVSQAILAKTESFEPDLVLALAQAPLTKTALRRLQRDKITTAMWFVEDHTIFKYWRAFAPEYDFFFVIQKEPFLSALSEIGVKQAHYLPMAALPSFHRQLELNEEDKAKYGSAVSFLGAGYPNRRIAFRQFTRLNFKIWGSDWEGESILAGNIQEKGARIEPEQAIKIFNASAVNLNLHSSVKPEVLVGQGDFVNPRTFELAACNAFQLVDKRSLLPELFNSDELVCFENMEELHSQIAWYLSHEEERKLFAQKAKDRVLKEHTYLQRCSKIIEIIEQTNPNFIKPRPTQNLDFLDKDLQNEVADLLKRLNLNPQADFEALIASLRSKSGILNNLESSLLFLDEWRKQYGKN